jgi:phosphatidate cytidylyltransferase
MALNLQTFRTRALTAFVFAVVMLGGALWNSWSFFILFSVIHFGCWFEYQRIVAEIDAGYREITPFHRYGVMIAGWCLMLWFSGGSYSIGGFLLHEAGWWLGLVFAFILPLTEILFNSNIRPKNIGHSFFGLVYISVSLGLMMDLQAVSVSLSSLPGEKISWIIDPVFPVLIIYTIWINDTMAYITGSLIGRTPLTKISPKKTWEGTLGGIILAVALVGSLAVFVFGLDRYAPAYHWYIICTIAAVMGTLGDLLESKLKRLAGVKDSGSIMPGHGGFLDRFDSMLVATIFVWLYVRTMMID